MNLGGTQRGHVEGSQGGDPEKEGRVLGVTRIDQIIPTAQSGSGRPDSNQPHLVQSGADAGIPGHPGQSARLVTGGAVGIQIGSHPTLQRLGFVGWSDQSRHLMGTNQWCRKVASRRPVIQLGEYLHPVTNDAIELGRVEASRPAIGRIVAGQAFVPRRKPPVLGNQLGWGPGIVHGIGPVVRNQIRVGPLIIPPVAGSRHTVGGLDEDPGFHREKQGVRTIIGTVKVLHPDRPHREAPRSLTTESHGRVVAREGKPTTLEGVIGPEGCIDLVGNQSGARRQGLNIFEQAGLRQPLGPDLPQHRAVNQAENPP